MLFFLMQRTVTKYGKIIFLNLQYVAAFVYFI